MNWKTVQTNCTQSQTIIVIVHLEECQLNINLFYKIKIY